MPNFVAATRAPPPQCVLPNCSWRIVLVCYFDVIALGDIMRTRVLVGFVSYTFTAHITLRHPSSHKCVRLPPDIHCHLCARSKRPPFLVSSDRPIRACVRLFFWRLRTKLNCLATIGWAVLTSRNRCRRWFTRVCAHVMPRNQIK
jgi:hypothetical protein